ncbi:hypothetical protein TEA_022328 [Camellia sinensis var. sinensis]|uniref:Uncharacterized protein n=1 Tax=Camellia sinensis var. sinensis TaxID=542762 RepID=A0A4S4D3F1_CAMSN|nr:hypothetical protein TEA_022328 [Camellia sinensis var. sinensis]
MVLILTPKRRTVLMAREEHDKTMAAKAPAAVGEAERGGGTGNEDSIDCFNQEEDEDENDDGDDDDDDDRSFLRMMMFLFPWLRALDDVKQKHMYALELGKGLLEEQKTWNQPFYWEDLLASEVKVNKEPNPLGEAIKHGILELVKIILKKFPEASNSFDKNGRNIIHMAVEYKHILIYEHLKKHVDHKEKMYDVDSDGNTILHVAATSENVPKFLVGQVLSMAWDLFWFKAPHDVGWSPCARHMGNISSNYLIRGGDLFEDKENPEDEINLLANSSS